VTTQTGIEPKKPVKPELACEVTPSSDNLLMKDLPRPESQGAGTITVSPFAAGPATEETYNTIDLGDPGTSLDVLRPVELGTETAYPPASDAHRVDGTPPKADRAERKTDALPEAAIPQDNQSHTPVRTAADAPPAVQTAPAPTPKKDSNFKATLAGGVLGPQGSTKAATQRRPNGKPESAPRAKPWIKILWYLGGTLVTAIGIAFLVAQKPSVGTITGVVVDAQTGRVIPSATVELDGRMTAATNAAGLYAFGDIRSGSYVVKASAAGYQPQTGTVQSTAPQSAQLSFALAPLASPTSPPAAPTTPASAESAQGTASTTTSPAYGGVDLEVDFEGYLVFVDGEIYGKNARKLKRLTTGEHRILLQVDGFQDYATTVTIKARATSTVTIAKADLAPKVDPIKRSRGLFAEGKEYLDQNQWQPAIEAFDQALVFEPQNADAVRYRGWAYMKAGDTAKAAADFRHAAQLYDDSKRLMDAVTCGGYLIDLSPGDPALWRKRGDYYLGLTEYAKAISDYERAIKLDKKSVENQMALGEAYYASCDFRRAAKEFDRARKMSSDPVKPYMRMILAYYRAGDNDELMKKYRDFAKIAPQDLQRKLQADPEWLPVLQIIGPEERHKN
jgi:Flp pilus assembly protein TadD